MLPISIAFLGITRARMRKTCNDKVLRQCCSIGTDVAEGQRYGVVSSEICGRIHRGKWSVCFGAPLAQETAWDFLIRSDKFPKDALHG
jgi:hypothetical protein